MRTRISAWWAVAIFVVGFALGIITASPTPQASATKLCDSHVEHWDQPFGPKAGEHYVAACAVGNGGAPYLAPKPEEEPAPDPEPAP